MTAATLKKKPGPKKQGEGFNRNAFMAKEARRKSAEAADIGPIPPVADQNRRDYCEFNLLAFLQWYFPFSTGLSPFSDDHIAFIDDLEDTILNGGRLGKAVYRGFAKTTIGELAAGVWAPVYGHTQFTVLAGADAGAAKGNLDSIKGEYETNDRLLEDFPEVCFPIRELDGRPQRCATQSVQGKPTNIQWTAEKIVLPTVEDSRASGCCFMTSGFQAINRGLKHKRTDGKQVRPDFVLLDDIQTDQTAATAAQVEKTEKKLQKTVLRLAGHKSKMGFFYAGTIIQPHCMTARITNSEVWPSVRGTRVKMVREWSEKHDELWLKKYADLRNTFDREQPGDQTRARQAATDFYLANRDAMDAGCEISWRECYSAELGEISAIQHAYNILIDDGEEAFASECQNEPMLPKEARSMPTPEELLERRNGLPIGTVPDWVEKLTCFIDVQDHALWYAVCGFREGFDGAVIQTGAWPRQDRLYYTYDGLRSRLSDEYPKMGREGRWRKALGELCEILIGTPWKKRTGETLTVSKAFIDAQDGDSRDTVYLFCQESVYRLVVMPSHGKYVGASSLPLPNLEKGKPKYPWGPGWIQPVGQSNSIAHTTYDANKWKSFVLRRMQTAVGDTGNLQFNGERPDEIRMLCDQMLSEYFVETEGRNRKVEEWKQRLDQPDNHLFDCVVGCHVAASTVGVSLMGENRASKRPQRKSYNL